MRLIPYLVVLLATIGSHAPLDAHRLKTGRFVHLTLDHGQEIGRAELTIRRLSDPERYEFSANITGRFTQRWTSVASPAFDPISATITFGMDTQPRFALHYAGAHVTGFVVRGTRRSVDTIVPAGTVDQRIDWAAVMASDLAPGRELHFGVYDPSLGVSPVTVTVDSTERIVVPAGTFDTYHITYRIAKATGTEAYQVFVTRDPPRLLVREIFPDGVMGDLSEVH